MWILLIWLFDPAYMMLSFDDSFYYLKVAHNLVSGFGVSFDRINTTNGFHSLWMIVTAAFSLLIGDSAPVLMRTLLTLQIALVYAGTNLLATKTPVHGPWVRVVTALLLTNFYCTKIVVNGQESALQYFLMCLALRYWWGSRSTADLGLVKNQIIIGFMLGMTTLARIDAVVFSAAMITMPILWPKEKDEVNVRVRMISSTFGMTSFLLLVAPYVLWNLAAHCHLLPVSAAVKMEWTPPLSALQKGVFWGVICVSLVLYWQFGRRARENGVAHKVACFSFPVVVYAAAESAASYWMHGAFMPPLWYCRLTCCLSFSSPRLLSSFQTRDVDWLFCRGWPDSTSSPRPASVCTDSTSDLIRSSWHIGTRDGGLIRIQRLTPW